MMEDWEREYHISRIVSAETDIEVGGRPFILSAPSRGVRRRAAIVHRDVWQECRREGVLTQAQLLVILQDKRLWLPEDEEQRSLLAEKIDDLKVGLFERWSRSNERFMIRQALETGRAELARLEEKLHGLDHLTCDGVASSARFRYLTGHSLLRSDGTPHWSARSDWERPDEVLDELLDYLLRNRLGEAEFREMARTEPWRGVWSSRGVTRGVFDVPAVDLTADQVHLVAWSTLYDNVREHPEAPDDSIVQDDDMLDGWLIAQRRGREKERARKRGDEIKNDKIRNSAEIFVKAETVEDARRVDQMNDNTGMMLKSQRMALLKTRGEVPEQDMPDTAMRLQADMTRMAAARMRGGG